MEPHVQILTAIIGVGVALAGLILRLSTRIDALDKKIDKIHGELSEKIDKIHGELNEKIDKTRTELSEKLGGTRAELNEKSDKTTDRLGQVEQGLAALKATVETFFRVRVDPPDSSPGSSPNAPPEDVQRRTGTDG